MMLPSGYIERGFCGTNGSSIIDTGIATSKDIKIEIAFKIYTYGSGTTRNYILGARDTSSNTAPKQITLCKTFSNGYYLGYFGTNTLISSTKGDVQIITYGGSSVTNADVSLFTIDGNEASLTESIAYNNYDTSSISDNPGNRTIYLFGMNDAGTTVYAPSGSKIIYCKIWNNGTLVRDYIPCANESTNRVGLYDLVNDTFHDVSAYTSGTNNNYYVISPTADVGGEVEGTIGQFQMGNVTAKPLDGYVFKYWEYNNSIISYQNPLPFDSVYLSNTLGLSYRDTFNPKAVFGKKTEEFADVGFWMWTFTDVPTRYSTGGGGVIFRYLMKGAFPIRSGSISLDGTQKTVSTFYLNGEFSIKQGDFVYIVSQTGKNVYRGIVESVEDRKVVCNELNTLFDKDVLLHDNTSKTITYGTTDGSATITIPNSIISFALEDVYLRTIDTLSDSSYTGGTAYIPSTRFSPIRIYKYPVAYSIVADDVYGEPDKTNYPLNTSTGVSNLGSLIGQLFNSFGIYVDNITEIKKEIRNGTTITYLDISFFPRASFKKKLVIGDNSEQISNISVTEESGGSTYLAIFNQAGTSMRATYYINDSGVITKESLSSSQNIYIPKVVSSDDNINTLVQQNLNAGKYNHKITFDVALTDLLRFDDFVINKKVSFYYGGKLYESIITALKYDLLENKGSISSINVTLGMARSNLTSKLNLGKTKKK